MPIRPLLRAWFLLRAGRFRMSQPRPRDVAVVAVPGPDPIRVLVTGAGLAAGYGVQRQQDTLAGALGRRLAERTGRGVRVDVDAAPLLPARSAVAHIGPDGARDYRFAVFAPCYLEASAIPGTGLRRHGGAIQQHLLDTGGRELRVAMVGVPRPSRFSRLDLDAARSADAANGALRAVVEREPRARFVEPPPFVSVRTDRPFDEGYYAALGEAVADVLVP